MTERERKLLANQIAIVFVAVGGVLTVAYAIYFIVDHFNKWY